MAVSLVAEADAWAHRVASLDRPDEEVADQLERLAGKEMAAGQLAMAATHLQWASDISTARVDRERRLLTAARHLTLVGEARGLELRAAVEACAPSPLRSCVIGTMALFSGQLTEAELWLRGGLAEARRNRDDLPLAADIAARLAGVYILLGEAQMVKSLARWALGTRTQPPASESATRAIVAIGAAYADGPLAGLAELDHLEADPARVEAVHVDRLTYRGMFHFLAGDLPEAVADLTASVRMIRKEGSAIVGLNTYGYLALAQYFSGAWEDALLTSEQALSAAIIHPRDYQLPLLHLAATCVTAGRGATAEAEQHAGLAEKAAAALDYGHERLYTGAARALVCQAAGDYRGMAGALHHWLDGDALDGRARLYVVIWGPLLIEGLIGSGRCEEAATALGLLGAEAVSLRFVQPAFAWLQGWLAEQQGHPELAGKIYQEGEDVACTDSSLFRAQLLLAHGRLLRRTGRRRPAVDRLRQADELFRGFGAVPFIARTEEELAACGLRPGPRKRRSALEMTSRELEIAHLIGQKTR